MLNRTIPKIIHTMIDQMPAFHAELVNRGTGVKESLASYPISDHRPIPFAHQQVCLSLSISGVQDRQSRHQKILSVKAGNTAS